jgi:hypothetical protein
MATIEQLPGDASISMVKGDDLNVQFSVDENLSGYSFLAEIHELNGGPITCTTSLVASASSSTVQVTFPASVTGALEVTGKDGAHNWRLVYTDVSGLTRTWVKGAFTVLTDI